MQNFNIQTYGASLKEILTTSIGKNTEYSDIHLVLYTDGGADNNGDKIGGFGVHGYWYNEKPTKSNSGCKVGSPTKNGFVRDKVDPDKKVNVLAYVDFLGGLAAPTTNNIAEMTAVMWALHMCTLYPIKSVKILMDSEYVLKGLTEYVETWANNQWRTSKNLPVANKELWVMLDDIYQEVRHVYLTPKTCELIKIKGHSNDIGNDKADELATAGAWAYRNYPDSDTYSLNIKAPDNYWANETFHPLFTEGRLFVSPSIEAPQPNIYYQATIPVTGSESERTAIIGKRVSDVTTSVVLLDKPDTVLDGLNHYARQVKEFDGIFKSRLDLLKNVNNYRYLHEYPDGRYLVYNDKTGNISTPNNVAIFNRIDKPRLAFKIFNEFGWLQEVLNALINKSDYPMECFDITNHMYERVLKGKKDDVYVTRLIDTIDSSIDIDVVVNELPLTITLTIGVDIPNRLSLSRFKDLNPEVTLVITGTNTFTYNYFVIFKMDGGVGIWAAPYSNEILIIPKESNHETN